MTETNISYFTCKICGKRCKAKKNVNQRNNSVGQRICGNCGEYFKTSVKMTLSMLLGIIIGLFVPFLFNGKWIYIICCLIFSSLLFFLYPFFLKFKGRKKYYTEEEAKELWKF